MNLHRVIRKQLYEYVRGELSDAEKHRLESHLASCARCSNELSSVRTTVKLMETGSRRPSDHRSELYWQQFADKVDRRIEQDLEENAGLSIVRQLIESLTEHRKPFGIGFASALTLVMIAFGIWSIWIKNPTPAASTTAQSAQPNESVTIQKTALESRAQDYLEQSKVLLIGLMNTDTKTLGSSRPLLEREQLISRKLVSESRVLTAELNDPSQRRLKELISDLQLILMQIANLGANHDLPGVEIIKGGIEHNDILFKINLEEIQRTTKHAAKNNKSMKRTT